ncbi:type IX secretion system membrane protein PorP/SprF [Lutibacter sp. A80]|uniref:PorP/SprF family type IX secretion system membrane protein n=1 Tax=Lutibacter sp. A80 TaxID=2918453 RepID=UPI001F050EDF|nr:type IX secretion system membrane protein PorP/SprF [Lutibacter sp. A80]UMB59111.1 type IX secretion system membrane protein PorP/SprF [Lutibacter sp. A80]
MKNYSVFILIYVLIASVKLEAQETLPIYSDYLSDNVFLVHPSAAGFRDCGNLRVTARNQWSGIKDAPSLQTLSVHSKFGTNAGLGLVIFNDKNGYHSQQGIQATYAYHLDLGRLEDYKKLSFGLSFMMVNNKLDESSFNIPDPVISQIVQSEGYFNADFSMAYHNIDFFGYFTIKNLMLNARNLYNSDYESLNLRRYLLSFGYYFDYYKNRRTIEFEPSVMIQYIERTNEKFIDLNMKVYRQLPTAKLWAAFSYRRGFDVVDANQINYLTPIVGVNFEKYMLSYTYTKQTGEILFDDASYHQITLGFNFGCTGSRRFWNERGGKTNRMF